MEWNQNLCAGFYDASGNLNCLSPKNGIIRKALKRNISQSDLAMQRIRNQQHFWFPAPSIMIPYLCSRHLSCFLPSTWTLELQEARRSQVGTSQYVLVGIKHAVNRIATLLSSLKTFPLLFTFYSSNPWNENTLDHTKGTFPAFIHPLKILRIINKNVQYIK